jgi:hypothetical protein
MKLSNLKKTWILDLDGTLLLHNGHKNGQDVILPGVKEFLSKIEDDFIIIVTARDESDRTKTEEFLKNSSIKYNTIVFAAPVGERIIINDEKPSGLVTAHAVSVQRNFGLSDIRFEIDEHM